MYKKTAARQQSITTLRELVAVLRKQADGLRRTIRDKDRTLACFKRELRSALALDGRIGSFDDDAQWHDGLMPLDTAQNSETIYRKDEHSG